MLQDEISLELLDAGIATHPLFDALPQGALWKVVTILQNDVVRSGVTLISVGTPTSSLYVLKTGYCDLVTCDPEDGRGGRDEYRTQVCNDGSSFGELAVLGIHPVSRVAASTRTVCELNRIQQDALFDAFAGLPEVVEAMKARVKAHAPAGYRTFYR